MPMTRDPGVWKIPCASLAAPCSSLLGVRGAQLTVDLLVGYLGNPRLGAWRSRSVLAD